MQAIQLDFMRGHCCVAWPHTITFKEVCDILTPQRLLSLGKLALLTPGLKNPKEFVRFRGDYLLGAKYPMRAET